MFSLFTPFHHLTLLLLLVQSVSLYRISPISSASLIQSLPDLQNENLSQESLRKPIGYDDDDDDASLYTNSDEVRNDLPAWLLSPVSYIEDQDKSLGKRSFFSISYPKVKGSPQRRNNRPHWNPLVAAYKRCGASQSQADRESCFKNAVQMIFLHKLRK